MASRLIKDIVTSEAVSYGTAVASRPIKGTAASEAVSYSTAVASRLIKRHSDIRSSFVQHSCGQSAYQKTQRHQKQFRTAQLWPVGLSKTQRHQKQFRTVQLWPVGLSKAQRHLKAVLYSTAVASRLIKDIVTSEAVSYGTAVASRPIKGTAASEAVSYSTAVASRLIKRHSDIRSSFVQHSCGQSAYQKTQRHRKQFCTAQLWPVGLSKDTATSEAVSYSPAVASRLIKRHSDIGSSFVRHSCGQSAYQKTQRHRKQFRTAQLWPVGLSKDTATSEAVSYSTAVASRLIKRHSDIRSSFVQHSCGQSAYQKTQRHQKQFRTAQLWPVGLSKDTATSEAVSYSTAVASRLIKRHSDIRSSFVQHSCGQSAYQKIQRHRKQFRTAQLWPVGLSKDTATSEAVSYSTAVASRLIKRHSDIRSSFVQHSCGQSAYQKTQRHRKQFRTAQLWPVGLSKDTATSEAVSYSTAVASRLIKRHSDIRSSFVQHSCGQSAYQKTQRHQKQFRTAQLWPVGLSKDTATSEAVSYSTAVASRLIKRHSDIRSSFVQHSCGQSAYQKTQRHQKQFRTAQLWPVGLSKDTATSEAVSYSTAVASRLIKRHSDIRSSFVQHSCGQSAYQKTQRHQKQFRTAQLWPVGLSKDTATSEAVSYSTAVASRLIKRHSDIRSSFVQLSGTALTVLYFTPGPGAWADSSETSKSSLKMFLCVLSV